MTDSPNDREDCWHFDLGDEVRRRFSLIEDDVSEVFLAYGQAMMATQLLERSAVLAWKATSWVNRGLELPIDGEEFEDAFASATLGALAKHPPIAGDPELERTVDDARRQRNRVVHRWFLENLTKLYSPAHHPELIEDLEQCSELFQRTAAVLTKIAVDIAMSASEVSDAALRDFGPGLQILMLAHPDDFSQIDLFDTSGSPRLLQLFDDLQENDDERGAPDEAD